MNQHVAVNVRPLVRRSFAEGGAIGKEDRLKEKMNETGVAEALGLGFCAVAARALNHVRKCIESGIKHSDAIWREKRNRDGTVDRYGDPEDNAEFPLPRFMPRGLLHKHCARPSADQRK